MTAPEVSPGELAPFLLGLGFVSVPLQVNAVGHFELAAEVTGRRARFLLDTGASHTVVSTPSAERFGLESRAMLSPSAVRRAARRASDLPGASPAGVR